MADQEEFDSGNIFNFTKAMNIRTKYKEEFRYVKIIIKNKGTDYLHGHNLRPFFTLMKLHEVLETHHQIGGNKAIKNIVCALRFNLDQNPSPSSFEGSYEHAKTLCRCSAQTTIPMKKDIIILTGVLFSALSSPQLMDEDHASLITFLERTMRMLTWITGDPSHEDQDEILRKMLCCSFVYFTQCLGVIICNWMLTGTYTGSYRVRSDFTLPHKFGTSGECSVCFNRIIVGKKDFANFSSCKHIFCVPCSANWLTFNETCPNCRAETEFYITDKKLRECNAHHTAKMGSNQQQATSSASGTSTSVPCYVL